jgi:hypothetical protein
MTNCVVVISQMTRTAWTFTVYSAGRKVTLVMPPGHALYIIGLLNPKHVLYTEKVP